MLMQEVKPIVIEKTEFGYRDMSNLKQFLQFLHYQDSDGRKN